MTNDFSQMTNAEIKTFLSQQRNNETEFSLALEVLLSRKDKQSQAYSMDMSLEEMEDVIKKAMDS